MNYGTSREEPGRIVRQTPASKELETYGHRGSRIRPENLVGHPLSDPEYYLKVLALCNGTS